MSLYLQLLVVFVNSVIWQSVSEIVKIIHSTSEIKCCSKVHNAHQRLRLLRMNAPNGVETCFVVILRINLAKRFTAAEMKLANHWVNLGCQQLLRMKRSHVGYLDLF